MSIKRFGETWQPNWELLADSQEEYHAKQDYTAKLISRRDYRHDDGVENAHVLSYAEPDWVASNRPTYLLSSDLYDALLRTEIVGIPTELIRAPFSQFLVVFPEGRWNKYSSCLVVHLELKEERQFRFFVQEDGRKFIDASIMWMKNKEGSIFPEIAAKVINESGRPCDEVEEMNRIGHVCIGLILLATHAKDSMFSPLLTKADEQRIGTNPERVERCHSCVTALMGFKGWVAGKHLKCPTVRRSAAGESVPSGRQLKYQHCRGGHFHVVRFGDGHGDRRVDWFMPMLVRPDLPPDPRKRRMYDVCGKVAV